MTSVTAAPSTAVAGRRDLDKAGRARRTQVPRSSQGQLGSAEGQDPVALLDSQSAARVQELVPVRWGRMLVSPFTFFRGAALLMADDLSRTPRSGLDVQLCGDAHLSNFGLFGSAERQLVFDLNDFDETHPGPFEWDVKRLAASVEIAGRDNGFTEQERRTAVVAAVQSYREGMHEFAAMTTLQVWYAQVVIHPGTPGLDVADKASRRSLRASVAKARTRDSMQALRKLTEVDPDGNRRIVSDPPLVVSVREIAEELSPADFGTELDQFRDWMDQLFGLYRATLRTDQRKLLERFRFVDMARKVVGVGSVGTRCWIVLLSGLDDADSLLLQAKQAMPSVLEAYTQPSAFSNEGERVVVGQRLMQSSSDVTLGWVRVSDGRGSGDYYFRQLRDWKGSAEIDQLQPEGMTAYARQCGWTLARAHARSGTRVTIASYLGSKDVFDRAVADFAAAYADKNERDYALLQEAAASGRIQVQSGL